MTIPTEKSQSRKTIFADYAAKYYEAGFSIIPIRLDKKAPLFEKWEVYCERMPTQEEIDLWETRYANLNIGLCTGPASGVVGFDFDLQKGNAQQIEKFLLGYLPPTPVEKRGQKGWTKFYKYTGESSNHFNKSIDGKPERMVDILSIGKQTVIPPSIHPLTGEPYRWTGLNDLLDINVIDLPTLPDNVFDVCTRLASADIDELINERSGRHDILIGYIWKLIEKFDDAKSLAEEVVAKDIELNGSATYFTDKKYFPRSANNPIKNALDIISRCEKTVSKAKEKRGEYVGWKIGDKLSKVENEEIRIKNLKSFYSEYTDMKTGEIKKRPNYMDAGEYCLQHKIFYHSESETLKFNGRFWCDSSVDAINSFLCNHEKGNIIPAHLTMFAKSIMSKCYKENYVFKDTEGYMNLKNGVFNIKDKTLSPHSAEYKFRYIADVSYEPGRTCERWKDFLNDVFSGDAELVKLIQQAFLYTLVGGYPFFHKAFCFYGNGRNGKSVVLNVLAALLGKDACSFASLTNLSDKFNLVTLDGKLANISSEEEKSFELNSAIFKALVGGDTLLVSYKGKTPYAMTNTSRLFFSCNDFPNFGDRSTGLKDRMILIPFDKYYAVKDRNPFLTEELIKELPGILNWALEAHGEVLEQKTLIEPQACKDLLREFIEETDTVVAWANENIIFDPTHKESVSRLYESYKLHLHNDGHRYCLSKNKFSKALRNLIKNEYTTRGEMAFAKAALENARFYIGTERVRGINGVRYRTDGSGSLFVIPKKEDT